MLPLRLYKNNMPSLKEGLHSEGCTLAGYETSLFGDIAENAQRESARAVAFHVGFVGEPSTNEVLDSLAKKCAETILSGECPLWKQDEVKGGFLFR